MGDSNQIRLYKDMTDEELAEVRGSVDRRRRPDVTPEQLAELYRRYENGEPLTALAPAAGMNHNTLTRLFESAGYQLRRRKAYRRG
jgi:hypothetical protein